MKIRILTVIALIFAQQLLLQAQNNANLTKAYVGSLQYEMFSGPTEVRQGEFLLDFDEYVINSYANTKTHKYQLITRDSRGIVNSVQSNNYYINIDGKNADLYRVGYALRDVVYISKGNATTDNAEGGWFISNGAKSNGPFDKIYEVQNDGYIVKNKGAYYYYDFNDKTYSEAIIFTILEKEKYNSDIIECDMNGTKFSFKPHVNVPYYKSYNGHYYLTYNDDAMDNTLLVVDGKGYNLNGKPKILLSFSHDGNHWIAAADDMVLLDGNIVGCGFNNISKVLVNNSGSFAWTVDGKDQFSDEIYFDGKLLVKGVDVRNITVDGKNHINCIIENEKGFFNCIDTDVVCMNDDMKKYCYPKLVGNIRDFTVKSDDGSHYMHFNYDVAHIEIDGKQLECSTIPHYARWNQRTKSFEWNVCENSILYIYRYKFD